MRFVIQIIYLINKFYNESQEILPVQHYVWEKNFGEINKVLKLNMTLTDYSKFNNCEKIWMPLFFNFFTLKRNNVFNFSSRLAFIICYRSREELKFIYNYFITKY